MEKSKIIERLISRIEASLNNIQEQVYELNMVLQSEHKSSAGDKHETSRSMVHLEQEKLEHQRLQQAKQLEVLNSINDVNEQHDVIFGSLVITDSATFLLGVGLGKVVIDGCLIYCVGMETPMGRLLHHKRFGDTFFFNGKSHIIKKIE